MSRRLVTAHLWSPLCRVGLRSSLGPAPAPVPAAVTWIVKSSTSSRQARLGSTSSSNTKTCTLWFTSPRPLSSSSSPLSHLLRSAFHSKPSPSSSSSPSCSTSAHSSRFLRRLFSTARPSHGPRSYYPSSQSHSRPSSSSFKSRLNSINPQFILFGLIALNVAVFLLWQYGHQVLQQYRDPSVLRWLQNNFTTSWTNIQHGRLWCVLTSCFSHEGTGHILMNLISLYFMGPPVMYMLGNVGFLTLYLFSGIAASVTSLLFSKLSHNSPFYSAHGASGAIYGTLAFFAAAHPRTNFLLFFVVPVPAWLCVGGILAWDLYGALGRRGGTTDSAGHVGGVLAGLFWFARLSGRFR